MNKQKSHRNAPWVVVVIVLCAGSYWGGRHLVRSIAKDIPLAALDDGAPIRSSGDAPTVNGGASGQSPVEAPQDRRNALPKVEASPPLKVVAPETPAGKLKSLPRTAAACLSIPQLNPTGKAIDDIGLQILEDLIRQVNAEIGTLESEQAETTEAFMEIKLSNGSFTPLGVGQASPEARGAVSTKTRITADGIKWIAVYPGEYAPLDDVLARKQSAIERAQTEIANLISSL